MGEISPKPTGGRRKPVHLSHLTSAPVLGRLAVVNHFRRKMAELAPKRKFPALSAFEPQNLWPWISNYLRFVFTKKYPFPDYKGSDKDGVYSIAPSSGSSSIQIAIAGDWATGTEESATIAALMIDKHPDYTIHLGDVYYVGDEDEIQENCFGASEHGFDGVMWPHGSKGSFAMNGNHEMYANGKPYFTSFLPSLGIPDRSGQIASFFCFEASTWRIIALDTGYNSVGIPILSQIPGLNHIPFIGGDCHLEDKLMNWLRTVVKPNQSPKPTLLLSHHQYFTAFKGQQSYTKPAKQMMEFFKDQEVLWIWGHEHRMAIYDKFAEDGAFTAYGRCLGHSGMPADTGDPNDNAPVQFYDSRTHQLEDGSTVGENGYLLLTINHETLTLDYRDINDKQVYIESFTPAPDGKLEITFQNKGLKPVQR
jgi:hypothetical protein